MGRSPNKLAHNPNISTHQEGSHVVLLGKEEDEHNGNVSVNGKKLS